MRSSSFLKLDDVSALIEQIKENLSATISAIRERAPEADLVWIVYPNYAMSSAWGEIAGEYQGAAELFLESQLKIIREEMADVSGLMLMDMFGAVEKGKIDSLLLDELHLNAQGHEFYAEELFRALGGVNLAEAEEVDVQFGFRP